jgi:hypothetical protein
MASQQQEWNDLKRDDMREFLKSHQMSTSGSKKDYIRRLKDEDFIPKDVHEFLQSRRDPPAPADPPKPPKPPKPTTPVDFYESVEQLTAEELEVPEVEWLAADIAKDLLPSLFTQHVNFRTLHQVTAWHKKFYPSLLLPRLWFFIDRNVKSGTDFKTTCAMYLMDPRKMWKNWDTDGRGEGVADVEISLSKFMAQRIDTRMESDNGEGNDGNDDSSDDEGNDGNDDSSDDEDGRRNYDSKKRREIREKNRGQPTPAEANQITIEDPETGDEVEGDILGINPTRRMWMGVALPSNNPKFPGLSRALWVDGGDLKYREAYQTYVREGANHTITAAADEDILEDCEPHNFEINCVLQMPWGKSFHTHSLGIPHFRKDREFMLFSKSLMARKFGNTDAQDLLHTHMQDAGQTIKTKSGTKRIKARAWRK